VAVTVLSIQDPILPGTTTIKDAHDFTDKIERTLRSQVPNLGRIMARTEPAD